MGKIFHPVVDKLTGETDDTCTSTMHNCSWTAMTSKGGQPYFHGDLELYYNNGKMPAGPPKYNCAAGPCRRNHGPASAGVQCSFYGQS
jgi:hypothetical protein